MSASPNPEPDPGHARLQVPPGPGCGCGPGHDHHHDHSHEHAHEHDHGHGHESPPEAAAAGEQEWTRRFLLFLELAVLLIWAVMMVWFYASGRITHYLIGEGTFRIQVLIGGLLLAVLGFFNWLMRAVPEDCGHDHGGGGDCGHGHLPGEACGHAHAHDHDHADPEPSGAAPVHHHEGTPGGRGLALALLALSVTAAVALTPDEFSNDYKKNMMRAYAGRADNNSEAPAAFRLTPEDPAGGTAAGGMTLAVIEKYQPRNQAGNFELGVQELYYSSADPEYAKVMKGQGVETVGQLVKDTTSGDAGRWRVFVLQMTCCAADARPISLPVQFDGPPPALQEMGWYRVTGKIDYVEERGIPVAVLRATGAQPSLRPKEQRTLF